MSDPTSPASGAPAAGWYDDGTGTIRYWDGATWTEHVAPAPEPVAPAAPAEAYPPVATPPAAGSGTNGYGTGGYATPGDPSGYGTAGYGASQYGAAPAAPQYAAPQYAATQYPPAQYAAAPGLPSDSKLLGILALVAAGVGALLVWVPYIGALGYLLLLGAIVLGIVALVKKQPKWMGITAIAVAVAATIISVVVSVILAFALLTGTTGGLLDDQLDELEQELGDAGGGTTSDAIMPTVEFGETVVGDEYEIVVNSIERDATAAVLAADEYNEEPEPGTSYAIVNATYTYTGSGVGDVYDAPIDGVDADGWPVAYAFATAPEPALDWVELQPGEPVTGNLVVVLSDDAPNYLSIMTDFDGTASYIPLDE